MKLEEPEAAEVAPARPRGGPQSSRRPARRVTTADAVYDALFDDIERLALPPATPLQEKILTERFGVSRTPVREALIRLSEDGLVNIFPQSGTFVSRIPVSSIPEAVMIRQALEEATVRRVSAIAGPDEIARLDGFLLRQRALARAGDIDGFHEADEGFHEAIALMAGYQKVLRVLRQVKVQINRARRLTLPVKGRMMQVVGEHQAIRNAIAAHDAGKAAAAMTAHLSVVIPDVDRLRLQYPDYFE